MTNSIADLATSDVLLVIGSNTTQAHPIIALHLKQAVARGAQLIVVDPRRTRLVDYATRWIRQKAGTNVALLNAIIHVVIEEGLAAEEFIRTRTEGYEELARTVASYTPESAEKQTGVPADDIRWIARTYATAQRASIVYAMGITQYSSGVDNVCSVANLAMVTGQIGRPGTGVNPLRGQNNVQGSCDVGGLSNYYPGYGKVEDPAAREKFEKAWGAELSDRGGLTAVEMTGAAHEGRLRGMYIVGENPMLSDPDVNHLRQALGRLDLLVVEDIFMTETAALADVVLPAACFAEKSGTFTSTERQIKLVRRAIEPPGEAMEDLAIINALARAIVRAEAKAGVSRTAGDPSSALFGRAYPFADGVTSCDAGEVLDEIAAVTPQYSGIGSGRLESGGIAWPCPAPEHPGTPVLHEEKFTRGLGKFMPCEWRPPAEMPDEEFPFVLTTGRLLEQYHTGTMARRGEGFDEVAPPGYVEVHPEDAARLRIAADDELVISSRRGEIQARADVTDRTPPGTVHMTFHYRENPANELTIAALDPISKIPEFKWCAVRVEPA
jgi:predicted molibdopterin-dependent oxidoreductase YjgC